MSEEVQKKEAPKVEQQQQQQQQQNKRRGAWPDPEWMTKKENKLLETYYRNVGVIPPEEFDQFWQTMKVQLPTTFRVTPDTYLSAAIISKLLEMSAKPNYVLAPAPERGITATDEQASPPKPISWYPNNNAWYLSAGRSQLRRCKELSDFHLFLVAQNSQGNITRQEAVSMIPPLLLDVKSHHKILDLCAAPGSKTTELLELLHSNNPNPNPNSIPEGFVVANDVDVDRCCMLAHQTKRMSSPCFLITCQSAETYPKSIGGNLDFSFDRVLCDVPCSGDGTLRKNPDLWRKWHPRMGQRQHKIQIKIAKRGFALLKPGGKMVYSTCSLNPIEDEAVVAELLRSSNGALSLIDVSQELPLLKRRNGISNWKVFFEAGIEAKWITEYSELPLFKHKKILPTCFQPNPQEVASFHLERCLRILPHDGDTGGFFVAVLQKSEAIITPEHPISTTTTTPNPATEEDEDEDDEDEENGNKKKGKGKGKGKQPTKQPNLQQGKKKGYCKEVDPIIPLELMDGSKGIIENAMRFYDIKPSFPVGNLITRSKDMSRMCLVNTGIYQIIMASNNYRAILDSNSSTSSSDIPRPDDYLLLINAGLKVFHVQKQRHIIKCDYRLSMESLRWVVPYMGETRNIQIPMSDFITILTTDETLFEQISVKEEVMRIDAGCFVMTVKGWKGMSLCAWKGSTSCHLLVPKEEVDSLRNFFAPNHPITLNLQNKGGKRANANDRKEIRTPPSSEPPTKTTKKEEEEPKTN